MSDDFLGDRKKALEDSFFAKQNAELKRKLREKHTREQMRAELKKIARLSDEQTIERRLDDRQLGGDVLTQPLVVAQLLRLDALNNLLGLIDQFVKLCVRAQIQVPKAAEELGQVGDGRVPKHLGLAVIVTSQPFSEMRH